VSYLYVKQTPVVTVSKKPKRLFAYIFFIGGILLFGSAIVPIVQYQFEYAIKFNQIVNPLSAKFYNQNSLVLGDATSDYSQLNNWFTSDNLDSKPVNLDKPSNQYYYLSIPKLNIIDATVEVGGTDLKKNIIQYPQTALPGQVGNAVLFGHSVLPQFFNPKSYLTIFSTLFRLKIGDEIFVNYDNIKYRYLVEEMYEVQPTDLSVLEQRFDGRYFTIVTCSPPGTYLRRLVVKARIVDL
jgi:sortase A